MRLPVLPRRQVLTTQWGILKAKALKKHLRCLRKVWYDFSQKQVPIVFGNGIPPVSAIPVCRKEMTLMKKNAPSQNSLLPRVRGGAGCSEIPLGCRCWCWQSFACFNTRWRNTDGGLVEGM